MLPRCHQITLYSPAKMKRNALRPHSAPPIGSREHVSGHSDTKADTARNGMDVDSAHAANDEHPVENVKVTVTKVSGGGVASFNVDGSADSELGMLKASKATPELNKLLKVLDLNPVLNWGIWTYTMSRRLFGATCKACRDRVQGAAISQHWFHQYCPSNPLPLRCRFCAGMISGLPFWQSNGIAHYGCLDKERAYDKMTPTQEETFKALKWGFPDSK